MKTARVAEVAVVEVATVAEAATAVATVVVAAVVVAIATKPHRFSTITAQAESRASGAAFFF